MSCNHQLILEHVSDLIEGNLPPALQESCLLALADCAQCRDVHAQALEFTRLAGQWQEQEVPHWDRARPAVQPPRGGAWHWSNWTALAASLFAVSLVLLQVQISTADGLLISFGGSQTKALIHQQLADELQQYTKTSDEKLQVRLDDFTQNQLVANQLLFAQWRETTRSERREELNFLMSGWQSQRFQDQQQVNDQLTALASEQIESNQYLNALMRSVTNTRRDAL